MLKVGLDKNKSVATTQVSATSGCGCRKAAIIKNSQKEKENRLQALSKKINKSKKSIYKTKTPIF